MGRQADAQAHIAKPHGIQSWHAYLTHHSLKYFKWDRQALKGLAYVVSADRGHRNSGDTRLGERRTRTVSAAQPGTQHIFWSRVKSTSGIGRA